MWNITADTSTGSIQRPEVSAGILTHSKADGHQGPTPPSLKFHDLSAILWVNPLRVPGSLARCLTPSDAYVINQVTQSSATVSEKDPARPGLRA